jgi:cytochrome o ubiquinol oxidase subunit 1
MKQEGRAYDSPAAYEDIAVPKNSIVAPVIGVGAIGLGFALVWHIWWLVAVSFVIIWGAVIARSCVTETERVIPASKVRADHEAWLQQVRQCAATSREQEDTRVNVGRAEVLV